MVRFDTISTVKLREKNQITIIIGRIRMTKLILFPYAGSLGLGYNQWIKQLKNSFEVHRIVYTSLKEGVRDYECASWNELMDLLYKKIAVLAEDEDYIFFGHSMGSRAAYEMYKRLWENGKPLPRRIIFSGCLELSKLTEDPDLLNEHEFREEYIKLGGISDEVLACEELADLAFTDLRKDVKLLSQYRFTPVPMKSPVTVLNGEDDRISSKEEWDDLLDTEVEWKLYKGKHFFIYDHEQEIIDDLFSYML